MKVSIFQICVLLLAGIRINCEASNNLRSVTNRLRFAQDSPASANDVTEEVKEAEEEAEELEKEEDDASINAKNLESEMKYRESLQSEETREENAAKAEEEENQEPLCFVQRSGKLDIAKDPTDVLTTVPQVVSIGKKNLVAHFPGRPEAPSLKIPVIEIKTPIETLMRTQRCFRLFHKSKPYVFCAPDTQERDVWVTEIYKAVFCINSGTPRSATQPKTEKGEEIKLPTRSTKVQRWIAEMRKISEESGKQVQKGETVPREKKKEVQEIEIIGSDNSLPKLTVNGDSLTYPHAIEGERNMNEGNQE